MNEQLKDLRTRVTEFLSQFSRKQKIIYSSVFLSVVLALGLLTYYASKPEYTSLYSKPLSEREVGEIKAYFDSVGYVGYKIENGTTIMVYQKDVEGLRADIAVADLQTEDTGYKLFSENLGFGTTDRQFDVVERDTTASEIEKLLKRISGVSDASVMITLPKEQLFVDTTDQQATAAIVLTVDAGTKLDQGQINTLYDVISKSIPNLSTENITISNQYSERYEYLANPTDSTASLTAFEQQRNIRKSVEKDIQQQIQSMLSTVIGQNKVVVTPYVKMNFDRVNTQKNLVEPVNEETQEGIAVSVEKIQKTYSGSDASVGGIAGTGEGEVPGYPASTSGGKNEYEEVQERINRDVNRITQDIASSPYVVEDLTINVAVEPPEGADDAAKQEIQNEVRTILSNVVRASLEKETESRLTDEFINDRIMVVMRPFEGKPVPAPPPPADNTILYASIACGVLLLGLFIWYLRRRALTRKKEEDLDFATLSPEESSTPDQTVELTEDMLQRKKLQDLAKANPEEFVKLYRTWLSDEKT